MRFLTECEWEGGASEGAISLLDQLKAMEAREALEASDANAAAFAAEPVDGDGETGEVPIELDLDDDASDGKEQTDEKDTHEWEVDGIGRPRTRHIQRPHAGGGGTR
jgi:hypothetical protein